MKKGSSHPQTNIQSNKTHDEAQNTIFEEVKKRANKNNGHAKSEAAVFRHDVTVVLHPWNMPSVSRFIPLMCDDVKMKTKTTEWVVDEVSRVWDHSMWFKMAVKYTVISTVAAAMQCEKVCDGDPETLLKEVPVSTCYSTHWIFNLISIIFYVWPLMAP